jgi:hypothetical protein
MKLRLSRSRLFFQATIRLQLCSEKLQSENLATMKRLTSRQLSKLSTIQKLTPFQRRKETAIQP